MFDIVMALYNKEKFVEATIDSVISQTFENWRLFVVDDGSADRSVDLVKRYNDPRIKLIEQRNQGPGPARNTGVHAGNADWVAFLDSDDVWNADHLEELDTLRKAFPEASVLGCSFRRFDGEAQASVRSKDGGRRLVSYFAECAAGKELFFTSSVCVRRSAIEEVGCFKSLPGNEDVELWARLALHGPVACSSRPTVNYRVATGGISDGQLGTFSKPRRREDLSSAIPTLEGALPSIADLSLREDVVAYMDSRIGIRLVAAVLEGDISYARELLTHYRGKPKGKARTAATIARLPAPLARLIMRTRLIAKRVLPSRS